MFIWKMSAFNLTPFWHGEGTWWAFTWLKKKKKKLENVCSTRTPQFNLDVKQQNYIRCLQTVEISVNTLGAVAGINKIYIFKSKYALFT